MQTRFDFLSHVTEYKCCIWLFPRAISIGAPEEKNLHGMGRSKVTSLIQNMWGKTTKNRPSNLPQARAPLASCGCRRISDYFCGQPQGSFACVFLISQKLNSFWSKAFLTGATVLKVCWRESVKKRCEFPSSRHISRNFDNSIESILTADDSILHLQILYMKWAVS